jgi:hypothetical protein
MTHGSSRFVLRRARATRKAQETVKEKWLWEKRTLLDWDVAIQAVEDQEAIAMESDTALTTAQTSLTSGYRALRNCTIQNLGLLKLTYRKDSIRLAQLANLSARGGKYQNIFEDALALKAVWNGLEEEEHRTPAEQNLLAEFSALIQRCKSAHDVVAAAERKREADWIVLNGMVAELEHANVCWFAEATRVFLKGTIDGDMIRSIIPVAHWKTVATTSTFFPTPARP